MTRLRLHNTATRKTEDFTPIDPGNVRMYVCGPTVYDRAHLGNARPVVVFDVLYRLLRHLAPQMRWGKVTYVRNFTDVDDKIIARAAESGRAIDDITTETTQWFLDDMAELGALEPDHMPRATEYIGEKQVDGSWTHMIGMIEKLVEGGFAYPVREASNNPPEEFIIADREAMLSEHALFEVAKFDRYGDLSGRSVEDMIAGARVEVAPYKRNPMDFVLWKPAAEGEPGWPSPWGIGRPGWHIECSAMAKAHLGDVFDIHAGGLDLMFPHHENEIAQSCCANGTSQMARYWLHNEMLQVEGRKMSKSLGNFFTVRDLLDKGYPGEVIRFVMLSTHYRKPMDWTEKKAEEAERTLRKWYAQVEKALDNEAPYVGVINALADDLNTHAALSEMHQLSHTDDAPSLRASLRVLGLMTEQIPEWAQSSPTFVEQDIDTLIEQVLQKRADAKKNKDYAQADVIRDELQKAGVTIKDTPKGTEWEVFLPTLQDAYRYLVRAQRMDEQLDQVHYADLFDLLKEDPKALEKKLRVSLEALK